tara:strand:- start:1304 stop:2278 length:975 start_codon:yes stop_codon:yes gene_type:complete
LIGERLIGTIRDAVQDVASAVSDPARVDTALANMQSEVADAIGRLDTARVVKIQVGNSEPRAVKGQTHPQFDNLLRLIAGGENAFLVGPAGSGKTTAARQVADAMGMELIVQPVSLDMFQALGFIDASGTYRESPVYRWAKSPDPALLLIDEVDGWMAQALVSLNPILDNRLGIFPHEQFEIVGEKAVIATGNTWGLGANAEYCGRNRQDAASLDRLGARVDWGYDEGFERKMIADLFPEHDTTSLVVASQRIRENLAKTGVKIVWGPRQTIGLARRCAVGFSFEDAIGYSALATLDETRRQKSMDGVTVSRVAFKVRKTASAK